MTHSTYIALTKDFHLHIISKHGKMAEWSKAGALKASEGQLSGGSNPSLSVGCFR